MAQQQSSAVKKKPPAAGRGRKPGVPNKATQSAREGIAMLVEANIPKMSGWLTSIEKEHGPLIAMKVVNDLLEYHVPKLQRTELTGEAGGPVQVTINKLA
jgi:hypothetical protein